MEGKWMQRTIRSGAVEEKYTFYAAANARPRGRRKAKVTPRKQDENEHRAERRLARLLNCNFSHRDLLITLTYSSAGLDAIRKDGEDLRESAERDLGRLIARIKYHTGKKGAKLSRYIAVTSDVNGDTGELVRIHHHLVVPGSAADLIDGRILIGGKDLETLWGRGSADVQLLHDQPDLTPVARYLLRQVRRVPDKAKYKASRGIQKPVMVDEKVVTGTRELKPPKGTRLLHRDEWEPGGPQYIRYVREENQDKRGGRKRE